MPKSEAAICRLIDIDQRPIHIVKCVRNESNFGPYLVMEDSKGRIILAGASAIIAQYGDTPTPFYIT